MYRYSLKGLWLSTRLVNWTRTKVSRVRPCRNLGRKKPFSQTRACLWDWYTQPVNASKPEMKAGKPWSTCMCEDVVFPKAVTVFPPCPHYELVIFQGHWGSLSGISGSHCLLHSRLLFPSLHPLGIPGFKLCSIPWFMCPWKTKSKLLDFLPGEQKVPICSHHSPASSHGCSLFESGQVLVAAASCWALSCHSSIAHIQGSIYLLTWLKLIQALLHEFQWLQLRCALQLGALPLLLLMNCLLSPLHKHCSDFEDDMTAEWAALTGTFDTNRTSYVNQSNLFVVSCWVVWCLDMRSGMFTLEC